MFPRLIILIVEENSTREPKAEIIEQILKQKLYFGQDSGRNWQSMTQSQSLLWSSLLIETEMNSFKATRTC